MKTTTTTNNNLYYGVPMADNLTSSFLSGFDGKAKKVATKKKDDSDYGEGGVVNPKTGKKEWKLAKKPKK